MAQGKALIIKIMWKIGVSNKRCFTAVYKHSITVSIFHIFQLRPVLYALSIEETMI